MAPSASHLSSLMRRLLQPTREEATGCIGGIKRMHVTFILPMKFSCLGLSACLRLLNGITPKETLWSYCTVIRGKLLLEVKSIARFYSCWPHHSLAEELLCY